MIRVYFLFSITTGFAIAATATIIEGGVRGKIDFMPKMDGNVSVTVNIIGLNGKWSY